MIKGLNFITFILFYRYNAKRASLVQSRIKTLERLPVLEPVIIEPGVTLKFPEVEKMSGTILMLSEVSFSYPGTDRVIFSNVDLSATMESRICIGANFTRLSIMQLSLQLEKMVLERPPCSRW